MLWSQHALSCPWTTWVLQDSSWLFKNILTILFLFKHPFTYLKLMTHPHYEPKDERSFSVSPFSSLYKSFKINNSFEEHILDSELKITCRKIAQSQYVQHNVNMTIPFLTSAPIGQSGFSCVFSVFSLILFLFFQSYHRPWTITTDIPPPTSNSPPSPGYSSFFLSCCLRSLLGL